MFFAAKWDDVIFAVAVNPSVVAVSGIVALRLAGRCSVENLVERLLMEVSQHHIKDAEKVNQNANKAFCTSLPGLSRCFLKRISRSINICRQVFLFLLRFPNLFLFVLALFLLSIATLIYFQTSQLDASL